MNLPRTERYAYKAQRFESAEAQYKRAWLLRKTHKPDAEPAWVRLVLGPRDVSPSARY